MIDKSRIHRPVNYPTPLERIPQGQAPLSRTISGGWIVDVMPDGELIVHCEGYAVASFEDGYIVFKQEENRGKVV